MIANTVLSSQPLQSLIRWPRRAQVNISQCLSNCGMLLRLKLPAFLSYIIFPILFSVITDNTISHYILRNGLNDQLLLINQLYFILIQHIIVSVSHCLAKQWRSRNITDLCHL